MALIHSSNKAEHFFSTLSRMRAICRRCRLSQADEEDVLQEVSLRWWQHAHSPTAEPISHLTSWLCRVTWALCADVRRGAYLTRRRYVHLDAVPARAVGGDAGHLIDLLTAAVDALPPDESTVVQLRLGGLEPSEIAATLGWSRAVVWGLLRRAVNRLRQMFELVAE